MTPFLPKNKRKIRLEKDATVTGNRLKTVKMLDYANQEDRFRTVREIEGNMVISYRLFIA